MNSIKCVQVIVVVLTILIIGCKSLSLQDGQSTVVWRPLKPYNPIGFDSLSNTPSWKLKFPLARDEKEFLKFQDAFNSVASGKEEFSTALAWRFQNLDFDKIPLFYMMCWDEILAKRGENYLSSLASYRFKIDIQNMDPFEFYTYLQNTLPQCLQNQDVIDPVGINFHYSGHVNYQSHPPKIKIKGDNLHLLEILESANLQRYPRWRNYKFVSDQILVTDGFTPFPDVEPNPLWNRIIAITHVSPSVMERIKKRKHLDDSDLRGINWRKLLAEEWMGFEDEKDDLVVYDPKRKILIVVAEERSAMNLLSSISIVNAEESDPGSLIPERESRVK